MELSNGHAEAIFSPQDASLIVSGGKPHSPSATLSERHDHSCDLPAWREGKLRLDLILPLCGDPQDNESNMWNVACRRVTLRFGQCGHPLLPVVVETYTPNNTAIVFSKALLLCSLLNR